MSRLAWSQLRFRAPGRWPCSWGCSSRSPRSCVLTAAARTSQLRTVGTVSAHFRAAYDILVRPKGARPSWRAGPAPSSRTSSRASTAASACASITTSSSSPGSRWPRRSPWSGYSLPIVPVTGPAAGRRRGRARDGGCTGSARPGSARGPRPDPAAAFLRVPDQRPGPAAAERPAAFETAAVRGPSQRVLATRLRTAGPPFGPAKQANLWCWSRTTGMTARVPGRA